MLSGSCSRSRHRSLTTSSRCQLPASSTTRLAFVIGAWLVAARKCVAIGATFGHRKCSGRYVTDRCARYGRRKATSRQSPSVVPKWPKPRQRACRAHSTTNLRQSKTIQANPRHATPRQSNRNETKRIVSNPLQERQATAEIVSRRRQVAAANSNSNSHFD